MQNQKNHNNSRKISSGEKQTKGIRNEKGIEFFFIDLRKHENNLNTHTTIEEGQILKNVRCERVAEGSLEATPSDQMVSDLGQGGLKSTDENLKGGQMRIQKKSRCRVLTGNQPNGHFNKEGWKNISTKLAQTINKNYSKKQMKNKWDNLKRKWQLWNNLVNADIDQEFKSYDDDDDKLPSDNEEENATQDVYEERHHNHKMDKERDSIATLLMLR
ncbi:hypothetical protein LWI29_035394 [Acer saccharum]|uniref:Myb/SANT-like domain-containing protein n=1 Tax=Acer saccharum TaxID=4024 RepID=A0AA39SWG8_ACESA|nr:hypothetical protein LWI29_035394 [Acer saccharum]